MKLKEIISAIRIIEMIGHDDLEIAGINIDSRKIEPGHLFVAVKGTQTDGHAYIDKAIEKEPQPSYAKHFRKISAKILHILR